MPTVDGRLRRALRSMGLAQEVGGVDVLALEVREPRDGLVPRQRQGALQASEHDEGQGDLAVIGLLAVTAQKIGYGRAWVAGSCACCCPRWFSGSLPTAPGMRGRHGQVRRMRDRPPCQEGWKQRLMGEVISNRQLRARRCPARAAADADRNDRLHVGSAKLIDDAFMCVLCLPGSDGAGCLAGRNRGAGLIYSRLVADRIVS